jgi:cystathionine beta-lyase
MYDFDKTINRRGTDCTKWDALKRDFGDPTLFPMWVADMDFVPLPELEQELTNRARNSTFGYTFAGEKYFNSIIQWNRTRNNYDIQKNEIISVPGVLCGLSFIISTIAAKGNSILLNTPVYNSFFDIVNDHGCKTICSSVIHDGNKYRLDFENMEEHFKRGVNMYMLCNPHNPLGRVWEEEELCRVVELCDRYDVTILSDEIHSDIVFTGHKHIPIHNISQRAKEIAIVVMAPSKTFNMAGLKSAMLIIKQPELRERIRKMIAAFHINVNLFGYKATETVYFHGGKWVDELTSYLEENARFTLDFLKYKLPKAKGFMPEGTYLMWIDFSGYGLDQDELMLKMINEAGVALNSGLEYGSEGMGHVRLNIGMPISLLKEGLEKIASAFQKIVD